MEAAVALPELAGEKTAVAATDFSDEKTAVAVTEDHSLRHCSRGAGTF